jgi:hypothetical protein
MVNEVIKIISVLWDLGKRILKADPLRNKEIEHSNESTEAVFSAETGKNGTCIKYKFRHKKSNTKFHFGIMVNEEKDTLELFISVNNAHMLADYKYLPAPPLCPTEKPGNEEGEVWYIANEQINNEYFYETTPEARKDEIVEQILMQVAASLDEQPKQ